jgi:RimJ/RimL family protein N-acetyltransferase
LGYWIGVPFWRNGFATEAGAALTDFAFRALGLNRVQAHHFARNPASGRVLLKIGLRREGASPQMLLKNGRFEDVIFHGVLRRDWPGLGGGAAVARG